MNVRANRRLWLIPAFLLLILVAGPMTAAEVSARVASRTPAVLDVLPFPGTPDASPQTDVSFPALAPSQLSSIEVTGSRSGRHRGLQTALPGGHGTAFEPSTPFVNGDRVTVHATLRSKRRISFSFGIAAPLETASAAASPSSTGDPTVGYLIRHDVRDTSTWTHSFHSENFLHPPIAWLDGKDQDPKSSGDIFTDAHRVFLQAGPVILNPFGELIWFDPLPNKQAGFDTQVQRYQGQQVLTFWQGYVSGGVGNGYDVIMNHRYQTVATVHAGHGYQADLHEFLITPQGNAFITAYVPVQNVDLRSVGGPSNGTLMDSIIQEVNISTGQVLFEWHAYGHVHLNESHAGKPNSRPYDFFHINSIQPLSNGNLLVSARNTWSLYEINMQTGKIPLVIGGRHSSFKTGSGANFEWQHDARMQSDGTITLFDNGYGYTKQESQSRAMRISLNYTTHAMSLVHAYTNSPPLLSQSQGSMQPLADGYTFVGWGNAPYMSEFDPSGKWDFSVHFHSPTQIYRSLRFGWWGQPSTPPDIAASATSKGTTVYAAWNGATDVSSWRVLAGSSPDTSRMRAVGTFPLKNFETAMAVHSTQAYFAVQALGSGGGVRATSKAVPR